MKVGDSLSLLKGLGVSTGSDKLGRGVYRLSEVAQYTKVPPATLRSWFKLRSDRRGLGPVFQADFETVEDEYAVSFLNLIEAYVAAYFRRRHVPQALIRLARCNLTEKLRTSHPFAHADLRASQGRIVHVAASSIGGPLLDAVSGQRWFPQWKSHLDRIEYGGVARLATRFRIATGIVLDPEIGFGAPVIVGTGVSTRVIRNQYVANEENADLVSKLFGLKKSDVLHAVAFEASLTRSAA